MANMMNHPPKKNKDPLIVDRKKRTYQITPSPKKSKLPEDIQALIQKRAVLSAKIEKIEQRLTFFQSLPLEAQLHELLKEDLQLMSQITDKLIALPKGK